MPYGESLMELSNREYDNPYKYNGKEMDSQTGLYYYGARYYDPQRSFWLSVDPLVEMTMSPYAYTWNDPVNYTDPTGMIGEKIGDPGGPSIFRRIYNYFFGPKHKGKLELGTMTSSREPDLPWYLNKSEDGGKPVLTLGAHNIEFPYLEREEYGNNILEYGDTFLKNSIGSAYNGLASMWNDGMAGKEGAAMMYEGDSDMESAVRRITRGNATAVEFEGIAAFALIHRVSRGGPGEGLTGKTGSLIL